MFRRRREFVDYRELIEQERELSELLDKCEVILNE